MICLTISLIVLKRVREFHYTYKRFFDKAFSLVESNIKNANLEEYITIEEKNFFFDTEKTQRKLHMVFNPPDRAIGYSYGRILQKYWTH
jgi:putative N6-adenine-specific DNA methylase